MQKFIKTTSAVGILLATASSPVLADDFDTTNVTSTPEVVTESNKNEVSKVELDKAKSSVNLSNQAISDQEKKVSDVESELTNSQEIVDTARITVEEAKKLVEEASPETIKNTKSEITAVEEQLKTTDTELMEIASNQEKAQENVTSQETVVSKAQEDFKEKSKTVEEANFLVGKAKENLDGVSKEKLAQDLEMAETEVTNAESSVASAETNLETAKETDKQKEIDLKSLENELLAKEEQLKTTDKKVTDVTKVLSLAKEDEATTQAVVDSLKNTITELSQTLDLSKSQAIQNLDKELTNLSNAQNQLKNAEADLERAKLSDRENLSAIELAQNRLATARQEYDQAKINFDNLIKQYNQALPSKNVLGRPYYNQRDGNVINVTYGGQTFGATGCVPTALAMIFSELKNQTIQPLEIANYLYNNTTEFNKRFGGTSGVGIIKASEHYGLKAIPLGNYDNLINALKEGHIVASAVQNNKFSPWGPQYSHEIVLKGYSNGSTYVLDPYNRANIGWYSIDSLWREQSRDAIDTQGIGAPFIKIMTARLNELARAKEQARNQLANTETNKNNAQNQLANLSTYASQVETAQTKLATAQQTVEALQSKVEKARADVEKADTDMTVVKENLNRAKINLIEKATELEQAKSEVAKVESELTVARDSYAKALTSLNSVRSALSDINQRALKTPEAMALLADTKNRLEQAKARLSEVKNDIANAELNLVEKQKLLTLAKQNLSVKEQAKAESKTILTRELARLNELKSVLESLNSSLNQTKEKRSTLETTLVTKKNYLTSLENASENLLLSQTELLKLEKALVSKQKQLKDELTVLNELESNHIQHLQKYNDLLKLYQATLEAKKELELLKEYQSIKNSGQSPIAIVNSDGKVIGYRTEKVEFTPVKVEKNNVTYKRNNNVLPKTGDSLANNSLLFSIISFVLGSTIFYKRKEN
ncbi:C39 family peptidase [Streptococcus canis]|uniref:C39 family peptidase n=1 Tax=Streptococcus canis TaxID=1329 RepID=UPI002949C7D0|nr:C39 family peptidase [Streptococcus canis]MDV5987552.1 C39 family peptidase [Streptococcus canis]